ncbi:MAG: nucleotidyltransferase family protein, partial [Acidobacteria bacterium]
MGTQKLLLPLDDEPLVRRTVRQVCEAGFDEVLVVVGHEHDKVLAALDGLPI